IYIIDYLVVYNVFLFKFRSHNGYLHSFPTRRSSDLGLGIDADIGLRAGFPPQIRIRGAEGHASVGDGLVGTKRIVLPAADDCRKDRKSTRLNSSHVKISYAVFCLKKINGNTSDKWRS